MTACAASPAADIRPDSAANPPAVVANGWPEKRPFISAAHEPARSINRSREIGDVDEWFALARLPAASASRLRLV